MTSPTGDSAARAERLRASLALKTAQIEESKKATELLMEQRRTLILAGLQEGALTYVEMAKASGLSKSQVYKIRTANFTEPALGARPEPQPA